MLSPRTNPPPKPHQSVKIVKCLVVCLSICGLVSLSISGYLLFYQETIRKKPSVESTSPSPPSNLEQSPTLPINRKHALAISRQIGLTTRGEAILLTSQPLIFDNRQDPAYICDDLLKSETFGCWYQNRIYLLKNDALLSTAAHEFLHAVFHHEVLDETTNAFSGDMKDLLDEVYQRNYEELHPLVDPYKELFGHLSADLLETIYYSELHSYIGTLITDLPPDLEAHYALYFLDRASLLGLPQVEDSLL